MLMPPTSPPSSVVGAHAREQAQDAPRAMSEIFPTTHATWLATVIDTEPSSARDHVMSRYLEPLVIYTRASSLRLLGDPTETVHEFFAARLADPSYLARWRASGLPLRRWLVNGLIAHARNRAETEARRRNITPSTPGDQLDQIGRATETDALVALERAWAMRVMIEAHDRVRSELDAEGKSAWWELFRLHTVQGLGYADASRATGVPFTSASHVNRAVAERLRATLAALLARDGVAPDEVERELALMQDLLG
jgi:DNA-directed RNA polymerase specialized sigma24 family protein